MGGIEFGLRYFKIIVEVSFGNYQNMSFYHRKFIENRKCKFILDEFFAIYITKEAGIFTLVVNYTIRSVVGLITIPFSTIT